MLLIKHNACTLIIVKQFLRRIKYSIFILFNPGKYPDRGQACQNIPFKSRRRAVSHHRNRIPKRVRKYHSDIEPAKKRPSNKYRKRRDKKTRDGLCSKNKMVTHIWHAKRFHMSVIDGNWSVPLTANEKNFRATYRSVAKSVYLEDLSYWQCMEISSFLDNSKDNLRINISGVIYNSVKEGLEHCKESSFCWLESSEGQTIAMIFCIKISEDKFQWWCHPSTFDTVFRSLSQLPNQVEHIKDSCLFSMLGPECANRIIPKDKIDHHEKTIQIQADEMPISSDMNKDSSTICITAIPGDKSCPDEIGAGYHVIAPKEFGYKLWLQLTHSRVFVGCLDSQEHLDVELKRLTSSKLQQDIL